MKKKATSLIVVGTSAATLTLALAMFCAPRLNAQGNPPKYEVDPFWPKPLPNMWVTGSVGGVCTDAQDHVFIVNRRNLTDNELDAAYQAPTVIEFDPQGNVANSWGDSNVLGSGRHGCYVDFENNIWIPSNQDGIVQKFTHDGSKLLLQIGTKSVIDSSDGTVAGIALNSSHTGFYRPGSVAVDPSNGDIYVADGEEPGSNHRVAVFDRNGKFLRQWVLQRTKAEAEAGAGDSCRYRIVWRLPTMAWSTYATGAAIEFKCSIRWETSKKTYLFLTRRRAHSVSITARELSRPGRGICLGRGARLGGSAFRPISRRNLCSY